MTDAFCSNPLQDVETLAAMLDTASMSRPSHAFPDDSDLTQAALASGVLLDITSARHAAIRERRGQTPGWRQDLAGQTLQDTGQLGRQLWQHYFVADATKCSSKRINRR